MPSLAELMFSSAAQNIRDTKSDPSAIARAYQGGARLAQAKEKLGMQKQQNEQALKAAKLKGIEQVLNVYKGADKFKNEADGRAYLKSVPNVVEAYGVNDVFTPEVQQLMQTSQEARQAAFHVESQVRQGKMTADEGQQLLTLSNIPQAIEMKRLADAEEFSLSEVGKDSRADKNLRASENRQQTAIQATNARFQQGEERQAKQNFETRKKNFTDFVVTKNALPEMQLNLKNIEKAIPGGFENYSGAELPGVSGIDAATPINQLKDPKAKELRRAAQSVANTLLKARSGGAVTPDEATRLLAEIGYSSSIDEQGIFNTVYKGTPTSVDFVNGMKSVKDKLEDKLRIAQNTFGDDAASAVLGKDKIKQDPKTAGEVDQEDAGLVIGQEQVDRLVSVFSKTDMSNDEMFSRLKSSPNLSKANDDQIRAIIKQIMNKRPKGQ